MKTDDRSTWIKKFSETGLSDLALVGGKNASLGEMTAQLGSRGIKIPGGFAVTSNAYRLFIEKNGLAERISLSLDKLDRKNFSNLKETGSYIRNLIHEAKLPDALCREIVDAYKALQKGQEANVAVRSSATAEDLPSASFAGQHESFLNVRGE